MSTINYISEDELVDAARNLLLCFRARLGVPGDTQAGMLVTARFTGMAELARTAGLTKSIAELEQTVSEVVKAYPAPPFDPRSPEKVDEWIACASWALALEMGWVRTALRFARVA